VGVKPAWLRRCDAGGPPADDSSSQENVTRFVTEQCPEFPVTTVSAMMGHANPSFTLACYGRDPRDEQAMIADVLERAAASS